MPIAVGASALKSEVEVAQAEMPKLEQVKWWKEPGLRKLYFWAAVLCVASATTGYDGWVTKECYLMCMLMFVSARMMLNTSQNLDAWQNYFNTPSGSKLGLMNAIYQIGSLASFPFV